MLKKIITRIPFNVKLCLITFFSFILIFNIWRFVFFCFYIEDFNSGIFLYLKSFYIGYRLDAVIAAFITVPIFIISHIPTIKFNKHIKFAYYIYIILLYVIISFLNVINIEFFKEFGFHLNMQAQMYGFESGDEAWIQIWVAYPVFLYLFMISFISYLIYRITKILISLSYPTNSLVSFRAISSILLCLFIIISARGGIQQRPVSTGHAFFTSEILPIKKGIF